MTGTLPGLLQPWGIIALALVFSGAFIVALLWHRRSANRPPIHLDVAAVGLLALLTGGFFWRALTESGVWMPAGGGDFASFYYPTYSYVAQQVKAGTIPLWNPHLFAGMPLAADVQSAIFYPLNWILFLLAQVDYGSLEWLLIAHYWLAATFTYLFLRDLGISRPAALLGGVVYGFCGFMTAHFGHLPMVPVATWLPLILLCLRRAHLHRGTAGWAWAVAGGLFTALSLLAGHVQIFAYGLLAAGLLWIVLLFAEKITLRYAAQWILKGALVVGIALAIGAVQLLPSVELASQSVRASVSYEEASEFPNQPVTMLNLLLPRVYGSSPTTYNLGTYQTTENWGYTGVVTLALAALGLVLVRGRMPAYFALLAVLAVVLMLGDLTIVGGWIFKFAPGFNKLRDAGRALGLLGLALAGLSAYGLDGLVSALRAGGEARRNVLWWLVGIGAVLAVATFGVMPALMKEVVVGDPGVLYGRVPGAINDLGMFILWLGLLAAISWAALRGRIGPEAVGWLVLALLVLDLFSPNSRFNPTLEDATAGFNNYDALAVLHDRTQDPRTGIPLRVNSDTNVQDRWQPSNAVLHDLYDTGGAWNPLKLERYDYLWSTAKRYPETPLYDLTGAAYEVVSPTLPLQPGQPITSTVAPHVGQDKWEEIYQDSEVDIYHNKNALPRAFLVHESYIENRPEAMLLAFRRFDRDPRHTVILESGQGVESTLPGTAEPNALQGESVRATSYTPNSVDLDVKATAPGWLVLTDAWYPGWEATVDGKPVPIEPADYAYRAVKIEPGTHTVSMRFRPTSWRWGRVVSLVSVVAALAALVLLALWPRISARRKARDAQVVRSNSN